MPMPVPDEPGTAGQLWRLPFQRDIRLERLQRGLTRMTKDVGNMPLIEPSENSKRKAWTDHSVRIAMHGKDILELFSLVYRVARKRSGTNSVLTLYTLTNMIVTHFINN